MKPKDLRIRMYDVGFGDCFLLTFRYASGPRRERHVLIDFGSTAAAKKGVPLLGDIARDIEKETKGRLDAVIVSHRHADHISGFATRSGKGSGDVIARCAKQALILQPWTEDPQVAPTARRPGKGTSLKGLQAAYLRSLAAMHGVAAAAERYARRTDPASIEVIPPASVPVRAAAAPAPPAPRSAAARLRAAQAESLRVSKLLVRQLGFLGSTNLKNLSAIKNLMGMSTPGKHRYLHYRKSSGLEKVLPGVEVEVLGPPTIEEYDKVLSQRSTDKDEFWHLQAGAAALIGHPRGRILFPRAPRAEPGSLPLSARWFVRRVRGVHARQLYELVRIVDNAMNNTSLILLFTIGGRRLLFPGDAQIENWEFALKAAKDKDKNRKALGDVSVYKVGHHGSLNATPKTLWNGFRKKSTAKSKPLLTVLSTRAGKHGTPPKTEVPRKPLVTELTAKSSLHNTQKLPGSKTAFIEDVPVRFD